MNITQSTTNRFSFAKMPICIMAMLLLVFSSCGGDGTQESFSPTGQGGSIVFSLDFQSPQSETVQRAVEDEDICLAHNIDTITASVVYPDNTPIASGSWPCDVHEAKLSGIPANTSLVLVVEALVSDEVQWSGRLDIDIAPSQTTHVGPITMEYVGGQNQPPVADAGPDQTVNEGEIVLLSGINSYDINDGIASFEWYQINGTKVELRTPDDSETWLFDDSDAWFLAPAVDFCGASLVFELAVTDYGDATSFDDCIVNVTNEQQNQPPVANAGADQTVDEGKRVYLDATASTDPNDNIVSYQWRQLNDGAPAVELSKDDSASPSFKAPDLEQEGR